MADVVTAGTLSNEGQSGRLVGSVVVTGGTGGRDLTSAEAYDPATGQWQIDGALNLPVHAHASALLQGGEVVVAGGYDQKKQAGQGIVPKVSQVGPS